MKTDGSHKETAFHRHPLTRRERVPLHSLGRTPAIFKAQLVFSEVRCWRERNSTFWGWQKKKYLPFHCISLKLQGRSRLPPRRRAEGSIDRAGRVVFASQRRCELQTSRCLYRGDLEHGLLTCPFLLTHLSSKKG